MIYLNKGSSSSSSRASYKSILHVVQNVWHQQDLLIHIALYDSAYFWVISWTLNYTVKTQWAWSSNRKISFKTFEKSKSRPTE